MSNNGRPSNTNPGRNYPGNASGAQAQAQGIFGTSTAQATGASQTSSQQRTSSSSTMQSSTSSQQTSSSSSQTQYSSSFTTTQVNATQTREYAERTLSNFRLEGTILHMRFTTDTEILEKSINLGEHLGFANDSTLSWEADNLAEAITLGASVTIQESTIKALYNTVDSSMDIFEKLRIFNGTIIMLSFAKRMYTQVPWMNFRILAVPTFTEEMERMLTLSSAKIASSTVSAASVRLMEEITKVISSTMIVVQQEVMKRVEMEVACLKASMEQEAMANMVKATNRDSLRPIGWSILEDEYKRSGSATKP